MYDYYGKYNIQIIRELMQAPIPDIKVILELLQDVHDPVVIQNVTDFLDKQIQNVLNNIEDQFQQSLLDVPGIQELKKKLQIRNDMVANNNCL